ncbi:hypothetical protein [Rhodoferax sp. GW822-FHT02A01]|uniref:DUF7713 domain-containing protein n=1 Tax=Rhodoferax sp. GW822-FHT02A01 TaxID=3141537 RepID=UPI00315CD045
MNTNINSCERCGKSAPSHVLTHFAVESGTLLLCIQCFNAKIARRSGIEAFDNTELEPIAITDADGISHTFHFQTRLLGPMVTLDAFELRDGTPGGYQFRLIGDPGEDRYTQLAHMVQKIRDALASKYLKDGEFGLQIRDMNVQGQIEADLSEESELFGNRAPMLVIDGREVSWEEFGRMLMTFEGFEFKLQIVDPGDA